MPEALIESLQQPSGLVVDVSIKESMSYADMEAEVEPEAVDPGPFPGPTWGAPWPPKREKYV